MHKIPITGYVEIYCAGCPLRRWKTGKYGYCEGYKANLRVGVPSRLYRCRACIDDEKKQKEHENLLQELETLRLTTKPEVTCNTCEYWWNRNPTDYDDGHCEIEDGPIRVTSVKCDKYSPLI